MRRAATVCLATVLLAGADAPARAERLVLSLSSQQVAINSSFAGSQLVVFGIIERDAQSVARPGQPDVVVTVRGPRESLTLRRKEPVGPIWLNRGQQKFVSVPSIVGIYATRDLGAVASASLRSKMGLGLDAIVGAPDVTADRGTEDDPYRAALIRLKRRDRLYAEIPRAVTLIADNAFRATIVLPETAPIGNYEIDAVVLSGGTVIAREASHFVVLKAGFEERVTDFARERPLVYGIATGALALLFGWFASVIFRRD